MSPSILPQKSPPVINSIRNKSLFIEKQSPVLARPRLYAAGYTTANPMRRLAAAVTLQAVFDAFYPHSRISPAEIEEAQEFLSSSDGDWLLRRFIGLPTVEQ